MERHIGLLLVLGASTFVEGNPWLGVNPWATAMDLAGVGDTINGIINSVDQLRQSATDKIAEVTDTVSGTINYLADKVDWSSLNQFAKKTMLPEFKDKIPTRSCVQGVDVQIEKSHLTLKDSKLRFRSDGISAGARVIDTAGEKSMDVEVYFEFRKAKIQYNFQYKNDVVVYKLDKSGKLLVTQRGKIRASIFGKTVQSLTEFKENLKNPNACAVSVSHVNATITGQLEHTKIKYYSVGIGVTQRAVSGVLRLVEEEIQTNLGKTLALLVEKQVRLSKLFCNPKTPLKPLTCEETVFRNIVI